MELTTRQLNILSIALYKLEQGAFTGHFFCCIMTLYKGNQMNLDELFDVVTKMIASPHTAIVEHDKRRAIQIFLAFDDFLIDHLEGYCSEDFEFDFGAYASKQLDEIEGK